MHTLNASERRINAVILQNIKEINSLTTYLPMLKIPYQIFNCE